MKRQPLSRLFASYEPFALRHGQAAKRSAKGRRRRLSFEWCESRHLLSGASITGITFDTALSSGFSAGDVPQGGVKVNLYQDNGDGIFDPNVDSLVDQQTSAAGTGVYTFSNVADGHYYIQELVPTGFVQSAGPAFYTVDVVGGAAFSPGVQVDDFSDLPFQFFINAVNSNPFTENGTSAGIIGGQRDLTVNVLGPANPISATGFVGPNIGGKNVFSINGASNGPGTEVTMLYNANGAGLGANLTANGGSEFLLDFDFLQNATNSPMDIHISLTGPSGSANLSTTVAPNTTAFGFVAPFASFSTVGSFSFTNVTSIQFSFDQNGLQDADYEISHISTTHPQSSGYNFGNFPLESCLQGFVYVDANNNGNKDLGEPPIAGVIVTLTGTNDLGQSINISTTTDSNGSYEFDNLRPGVYKLTETQPINFIDGKDTIGTPGGDTSNDMFSNINLPANFCGMNNNFGEIGLTPSFSSKRTLLNPPQPVNLVAVYDTTGGGGGGGDDTTVVPTGGEQTTTPAATTTVSTTSHTTTSSTSAPSAQPASVSNTSSTHTSTSSTPLRLTMFTSSAASHTTTSTSTNNSAPKVTSSATTANNHSTTSSKAPVVTTVKSSTPVVTTSAVTHTTNTSSSSKPATTVKTSAPKVTVTTSAKISTPSVKTSVVTNASSTATHAATQAVTTGLSQSAASGKSLVASTRSLLSALFSYKSKH